MCGIAGIFHPDLETPVRRELVQRMAAVLRHRGPDDEGLYVRGPVGLAVRRLEIVDPVGGAQPLFNEDRHGSGGVQRRDLQLPRAAAESRSAGTPLRDRRPTPRSSSTPTNSTATHCVDHLRGMFAFALWDERAAVAVPGARPLRHQAALLRLGRPRLSVRLGAQGDSPACGDPARHRSGGAR